MDALILAGGLGTRLRPLTLTAPKPILPLVNKPLLLYQIELFKKYGIKKIILSISYLPKQIFRCFGDGKKYGVKINYAIEKQRLGTGGGVKNSEKFIKEKIFISNGDIIANIDLKKMNAFHQKQGSDVTIALFRVPDPSAYGLVKTGKNGRILDFLEKPKSSKSTTNTINAGFYLFEPEILQFIPSKINYSLERGLFPKLLKKGKRLFGYVHSGYWQDLGTPAKYLSVSADILAGKLNYRIPGKKVRKNVIAETGTKIADGLKIKGKLVCGKKVRIEENVQINGPVVLGDDCRIGKGAKLSNCIIFANAKIKEGVEIDNAIIGKDCFIGPYNKIGKGTVLGSGSLLQA